MAKGAALVLGLAAAAVIGIGIAKASPKQPDSSQDVALQQYHLAMDPGQTDPEYVMSIAQWLASSGQRADLAAKVQEKYYFLKSEMALRAALEPGILSDAFLTQASADLETMTPTYAALVRQRQAVQNGARPPSDTTVRFLSGVGTMTINWESYQQQTADTATVPTPPVVVLATPTVTTPPPAVAPPVTTPTVTTPPPVVAPPVTAPAEVPPIVAAEASPVADPNGTIALAQLMLGEEQEKGWKRVSDAVATWQTAIGAKSDGKFGPKSALTMATEVGQLPLIRYWSLGGATLATQLANYRESLRTLAQKLKATAPEHAAALILSAAREEGQGWPKSPAASQVVVFVTEDTIRAAEPYLDSDQPITRAQWDNLRKQAS